MRCFDLFFKIKSHDSKSSFQLSVDSLSEIANSPYSYVWHDPVNFADPTGMMGERVGGGDPCDPPGKRSFVRRAWDWLFGARVHHGYKSNNKIIIGEITSSREPNEISTIACHNMGGQNPLSLDSSNEIREFFNDTGDVLGQVAYNLAPIRPASVNDPKTLGEAWNNLKNAPANIKNVYTNGSNKDQAVVTLSLLALMKGKSPTVSGIALAGFNLSKYAKFGMCIEFANAFEKTYGGIIKEINLQKEGFHLIGGPDGVQLSNNGIHRFVEKIVDGKEYIFDNLHTEGVLKSEYTKGLDAVNMQKGQIIYGEALIKNARLIK